MTGFDYRATVRELFGGARGPWKVGAEVELIAVERPLGRPLEVYGSSRVALLPLLATLARREGWHEATTAYGIPGFVVPGVGRLSFEPGGQIELSSRTFSSPSSLLSAIRGFIALLRGAGEAMNVDFLEVGLDPINAVEDVPLAFPVERYSCMAEYFSRVGGDGLRMMKQTASCQVSLDVQPDSVAEVWHVLNAVVPTVIAAFANSPKCGGVMSGDASSRARVWQNTDPVRTGIFESAVPQDEYAAFALGAPAFLLSQGAPAPILDALRAASEPELVWRQHLSTLFPEVRPRGYLEFRTCDMIADDGRAALLLLLCAIARDPATRAAIAELAGAPDPAAYNVAPTGDAQLIARAADALRLALASAGREPAGFWSASDLLRAERFLGEYTARGRNPAADWTPPLLRSA